MPSRASSKIPLIASLYVSQAVPLGFLIVALPAILRRQGLGLEQTGLLGALALPWILKVFWAPLVDRFGSKRLGHYRSWILPLQAVSVACVAALAGVDIEAGLTWLVIGAAAFMLTSATQDIATDGLAVRAIPREGRGIANGIQVGGYYLGQVLGGGVVLVLFDRVGWTWAILAMAALLATPLLLAVPFREPQAPARPSPKVDFDAMRRFARRPGAAGWIAILLLYRAGETMALAMFNPMLVDGGLSLEEIGLTLGVAGSIAAFTGALVGGAAVSALGRKPALVAFGTIQAVALGAYLVPAGGVMHVGALTAVAATVSFAGGMGTAALYTNMMDRSDPATAGTDFTLQQSLCAVGPLVGASLSGFSAANLGYAGHFAVCIAVALGTAMWVARRFAVGDALPEASSSPS